ncbi:IS5/IS1182 family transposase, partial [Rhizobium hainanense]
LLAPLPPSRLCAADAAYDSNALRDFLIGRGTEPVIPNNPTRKRVQPFDPVAYKRRNIIERAFCRLKDWRRVATRYDKLRLNFEATCYIAALVTWWID